MTVNLSILSFNSSLGSNDTLPLAPSLILMNGLVETCLVNCLSSFSLVNILFTVSTVCLRPDLGFVVVVVVGLEEDLVQEHVLPDLPSLFHIIYILTLLYSLLFGYHQFLIIAYFQFLTSSQKKYLSHLGILRFLLPQFLRIQLIPDD